MEVAIALGALIAALAPLYAMWVTLQQRARRDLESNQVRRIENLEGRLYVAKERIAELEREVTRLLRELIDKRE